jgi:hypothetical protein
MAVKLVMQIEVEGNDGIERKCIRTYDIPEIVSPDLAFEWLTYYLDVEARAELLFAEYRKDLPDLSEIEMRTIKLSFPVDKGLAPYFDSKNSAMAWIEIYNLFLSSRDHLAYARAYKAAEPSHSGKAGPENEAVYKVHIRKMDEFHNAVRDIKKIEDMILRLVFEALGASLNGIDVSKPKWEESLTRTKVAEAIKQRNYNEKLREMPDAEYHELCSIVSGMEHKSTLEMEAFWQYRTYLEHRVPESVDYAEQFPPFEIRPMPGQRSGFLGGMPSSPIWAFDDLYKVTVGVYRHYLDLLIRLDQLPTFRRPV